MHSQNMKVRLRLPNRFNSLYGAARSAQITGDKENAKKYYELLINLCVNADTERAELTEAKAFVNSN